MENRVIKFRIWNKKTNTWVEGHGPDELASLDGVNLFGETILLGAFMDGVSIKDLNDCVALQYIDIEDKNDKQIFEGDIVKWDGGIYQVQYCNNYACCGFRLFNGDESLETECENWKNTEVIGNIYENPDLIKK